MTFRQMFLNEIISLFPNTGKSKMVSLTHLALTRNFFLFDFVEGGVI